MDPNVIIECVFGGGAEGTVRACKGLLPRVGANVLDKLVLLCGTVRTEGAREGLLAGMNADVIEKPVFGGEAMGAIGTFVRLFSCVCSYVLSHMIFPICGIFAVRALMQLLDSSFLAMPPAITLQSHLLGMPPLITVISHLLH